MANTQKLDTITTVINRPLKFMMPSSEKGFKSQLFLLNQRFSIASMVPFS